MVELTFCGPEFFFLQQDKLHVLFGSTCRYCSCTLRREILRFFAFASSGWVLTVKKDKDGEFLKCKARWVLKGFQDKQKDTQLTDSPPASRSGFCCVTQLAHNQGWDLYHMDLKTAFLQGEACDKSRDIICQIPPDCGYPPHIAAKMKKSPYGLNEAPRRWWQVVDKALLSFGMVPTAAARCTHFV